MSVEKYFNIAKYSLFPICRSITGAGLKKTLKIIQSEFPKLKYIEYLQVLKFLIGKYRPNGMLVMLMF